MMMMMMMMHLYSALLCIAESALQSCGGGSL